MKLKQLLALGAIVAAFTVVGLFIPQAGFLLAALTLIVLLFFLR